MPFARHPSTAMWVWCGTCVTYLLIEVSIYQHETTMPSGPQRVVAMWMWCGACVTYLLIEV